MDVAVAGGHGKIALRLLRMLAERGDGARGLIRNIEHGPDLERVGATPVGADLENLDAEILRLAGIGRTIEAHIPRARFESLALGRGERVFVSPTSVRVFAQPT